MQSLSFPRQLILLIRPAPKDLERVVGQRALQRLRFFQRRVHLDGPRKRGGRRHTALMWDRVDPLSVRIGTYETKKGTFGPGNTALRP